MAGITEYKRLIDFVLAADQRRDGSAVAAVLGGIWELTAADTALGARVGERIITSLPTGAFYFEQHAILYGLVLRGWAETFDEVLEEKLAKAIHSTKWAESARKEIANRFSEFLKEREATMRFRSTIPFTVEEHRHGKKLKRFIVSAGDNTSSESVKVAAHAYLRLVSPFEVRALFLT
ncbi:MAG: hypothetical protein JWM39_616 [Parcubacteria group bacterium]|nr:hypothetical protein [Parcubacteria group bacterium]